MILNKVITNSYGVSFCPKCNGSVWQNKDESKYCFRCGHKLNWEDEVIKTIEELKVLEKYNLNEDGTLKECNDCLNPHECETCNKISLRFKEVTE